jgi:hypothetical protein
MWWDWWDHARRRGRQGEDVEVVVVVVEVEARDSSMEGEEGEGSWKLVAGATPSTLASADRTCAMGNTRVAREHGSWPHGYACRAGCI